MTWTSGVFLYMCKSLISLDGINDPLFHWRREMEKNQNQKATERGILSWNLICWHGIENQGRMALIRGIPKDQVSCGSLRDWWSWQLIGSPDDHWKRLFMLNTHRIIEYPELKGTNKDYPKPAPGPAQESSGIPLSALTQLSIQPSLRTSDEDAFLVQV